MLIVLNYRFNNYITVTNLIKMHISKRFRNLLPIVIDIETGGLDPKKDAVLEIGAIILDS